MADGLREPPCWGDPRRSHKQKKYPYWRRKPSGRWVCARCHPCPRPMRENPEAWGIIYVDPSAG